MKLRFALLIIGIPLVVLGGEGLYHAARSRAQAAMTCQEFVRQRPPVIWLRLSGCELDYASPGYRESAGRIAEIFFPVRPAGQPASSPAPLLAATSDPAALAIVQGTIGNGRQADQEAITVMILRVVTHLRAAREIEGLARAGFIEGLQTRRSLQSFPVALDPAYIVVDLHARPTILVPVVEVVVGLLAVLLFMFTGRPRRPAVPAPTMGVEPTPAPPLPAMLLLKLDPSAGLDAIETAPPLGTRDETIGVLVLALEGLAFDERGRAVVERPDAVIEIDIGAQDPVWTATVRASGAGATSALTTLAAATEWRLYVPKRGAFLDAVEPPEGAP